MGLGLVDTYLAYKFIKMLATPWKKMDAYKMGIIDAKGKRIRSEKADDAVRKAGSKYTNIHKVIINIKRLVSMVPGGKTRLGGAAAAIWLLREEAKQMNVENENIIEETFLEWLKDNDSELDDGMNESFGKVNLVVTKGDYILNGEKVTVKENTESFDSILGVPLFRVNDTVCSWYDLEKSNETI